MGKGGEYKEFVTRLKKWDNIEKGNAKYLQLLESLQESGRQGEKQRVELEEHNGYLKPEEDDIISKVIEKLETWFGKTKIDEASEDWKTFRDIKRSNDEKIDPFILRFETAESKVRNSAVPLPNVVLALQLIDTVNVTSDQRSNILTQVKMENTDTVYDEMKGALRLFKGNLVEDNIAVKNDKDEDVNYNKNENFRRFRSR